MSNPFSFFRLFVAVNGYDGRYLYQVGVVFLSVLYFILFIIGFFGGAAGIVFSLIIVPFLFVLQLMILRVCAEALLTVLLMPQYMRPQDNAVTDTQPQTATYPSSVVVNDM